MALAKLPSVDIQGIGSVDEAFARLKLTFDQMIAMIDSDGQLDVTDMEILDANLSHTRTMYDRLSILIEEENESDAKTLVGEM